MFEFFNDARRRVTDPGIPTLIGTVAISTFARAATCRAVSAVRASTAS